MAEIAWTDFQSSEQLGGLNTSLGCIRFTITANIVEEPGNFFPGSFHMMDFWMNDLDALLDKDTPIPKGRASLSSSGECNVNKSFGKEVNCRN
jgi:hypothetical protein